MNIRSGLSCASVRLSYFAATVVGALMLFPAASAQAAPITLGQTSSTGIECFTAYPYTELQTATAEPPSYTVPTGGGTIISWSHDANASTKTQLRLKVYRPTAEANEFTLIGESALEPISPNQLNTFPTQIPVQAGDLLGYTRAANSEMRCLFSTTSPVDTVADAPSVDAPLGATTIFNSPGSNYRINISAVLESPPGIRSISQASGPTSGGTPVTITGHDFTAANSVKFGALAAASFSVNSDTQITVISPPSTGPGPVDVTVTTPAGTSATSPADQFTYTARIASSGGPKSCIVPKLKGKKLKVAKKLLLKAECKLGKVKGKKNKSAMVKKQSAKPGTVLAAGSKVNVKVKVS